MSLSTRDYVVVVDLVLHGTAHSAAVQRPTDVEERCKLYTRMAMYKDAAELAIQLQDGDLLAMIRQSYAVLYSYRVSLGRTVRSALIG